MALTETKRRRYRLGALALFLAVIGIIFIANFVSYQTSARIDLTEGNRYTLSESTTKIISDLPDVVTIQAVYSSNMPTELSLRVREAKDLLREYDNYGGENLKVEFLDPAGDPELQNQLSQEGLQPFVIPLQGMDERMEIKVYASVLVKYLDKDPQVIRQALDIEPLEYKLTNAINRQISAGTQKVGVLNPGGQRQLDRTFGTLYNALEERFPIEEVDTKTGEPIGEDIKTLLVIGPGNFSEGLSERDLYEIDQYMMRGGNVVVLSEGVYIAISRGQGNIPWPYQAMPKRPATDKINTLLEHYGVTRNSDIVQSEYSWFYPMPGDPRGVEYPPFPLVDMRGEEQADHVINQGISVLIFAWPSSLKIGDTTGSVKATRILQTSKDAWTQSGQRLMVNPRQVPGAPLPIPGQEKGKKTLAALLSGSFESFYADKEVPPLEGSTAKAESRETIKKSPETQLLVIGNSYFVSDIVPLDISHNTDFVTGAVEWLMEADMLSDIKKRASVTRPFDQDLDIGDVLLIALVLPLSAPLLVVVAGIVRFSIRAGKKKRFIESTKS